MAIVEARKPANVPSLDVTVGHDKVSAASKVLPGTTSGRMGVSAAPALVPHLDRYLNCSMCLEGVWNYYRADFELLGIAPA